MLDQIAIPAQAQKNGNISQHWWQVRDRAPEAWGLEYDYLNRLTQAKLVAVHDGGAKIMARWRKYTRWCKCFRWRASLVQVSRIVPLSARL